MTDLLIGLLPATSFFVRDEVGVAFSLVGELPTTAAAGGVDPIPGFTGFIGFRID